MLAPPFVVTEPEIDEMVERFARALTRTVRHVVVPASTI
jgi:adenosylmethionine-8-amino-7-oxononanoate aminotransferase